MTHPKERIQIDVKFVPIKCLADKKQKLYQYTAIDEFTRLRFVYVYEEYSTYSSSDLLKMAVAWYNRHGIKAECVQIDNGFEFTTRFIQGLKDKPTMFQKTAASLGIKHKLPLVITERLSAAIGKITINFIPATHFFLVTILINSLKFVFPALITVLCVHWVGFLS